MVLPELDDRGMLSASSLGFLKCGFTLCNAVASNEAIEKGEGRTMLLATWLYAITLACLVVYTMQR